MAVRDATVVVAIAFIFKCKFLILLVSEFLIRASKYHDNLLHNFISRLRSLVFLFCFCFLLFFFILILDVFPVAMCPLISLSHFVDDELADGEFMNMV